jgi:uncharacterized protein (DUF1697 family)
MTVYVALLRGINVGGNNKIKMAELRHVLETLGLGGVQTYIQSGNALFESEEAAEPLRRRIEQKIGAAFGLTIDVVLRTAEQMERILADCPYAAEVLQEGQNLHVCLLAKAPSPEAADRFLGYRNERTEDVCISGLEIYVLFHQSLLESKLSNQFQKLGVPATMRNWNTMNRLLAMAKAMRN